MVDSLSELSKLLEKLQAYIKKVQTNVKKAQTYIKKAQPFVKKLESHVPQMISENSNCDPSELDCDCECNCSDEGMARARAWLDKCMPYSQKHYCDPNGETEPISTKAEGLYRTDCAGLVCMAWEFDRSYTTRQLFSNSFDGANDILKEDPKYKEGSRSYSKRICEVISFEDVIAGDCIYKSGHVMLVVGREDEDTLTVIHMTRWGKGLKQGCCREDTLRREPAGNGTVKEEGYMAKLITSDDKFTWTKRIYCLRKL